MKIDLGGGKFPRCDEDGTPWTTVDRYKGNIKCDLEKGLSKIGTNKVDVINASHILEHIKNLSLLMNECWRVLKPDGYIEICVPRFPHTDSVVDPTHVRFFVSGTFQYFNYQGIFWEWYGFKPWHLLEMGESENEVYCKMEPYGKEV